MIGNFPTVLNFNRLFLKLNRFICNSLLILPDQSVESPTRSGREAKNSKNNIKNGPL